MCTTEQNYEYRGAVDVVQTDESSDECFAPVCSRIVIAPSLNAVLKGTLAPVENIADIEHGIWNPDTPETFLHASLQFLENKLHSRIFQMSPTPSGKIVLSDGFIFSPIYPASPQDSQTTWDECVMKVHSFPDEGGAYTWHDTKRVNSVVYSCISLPGEHGVTSKQDEHAPSRQALGKASWDSQREIGVQTSTELFSPVTEISSSMVSDDETQPICNFSEYVEYCHSIVRPPSQLFNFGKSPQNIAPDYKNINAVPEVKYDSTAEYPFQPIVNEKESLPNSARTYASHYRSPVRDQEIISTVRDKIPPYEAALVRRSPGPSSKITTSTTTVSSEKSFFSNRTEHSVYGKYHTEVASSTASTKSVYYYARISASFFSFLNRATQKNKIEKNSRSTSIIPNVSSATASAISIPIPKLGQSNADDEKEGKLTTAKLNVLRRFMNFFGGAKASKEYEKIKDPSAAIIDVKTDFFDDDNIFESESKPKPIENNGTKFKCNSFSVTGKNVTTPEFSANVVASERCVETKESKPLSKPFRKAQTKSKPPRHSQRDSGRDSDQYTCRTATVHESPNPQKCLESTQTDLVKKPSRTISSIFGSKTSYSKTVCKDILKLRFEGDPKPVTATDTSHDENDCCICYKPPKGYRNTNVLPKASLEYFQDETNETDLSTSNNEYICYARIPENQHKKGNYRQQQNPPKQESQHKNLLRSFFKSRNDKKYSTCSTCSINEQVPEVIAQGKLVPKSKTPIYNQYCPTPQEYEIQQRDSQCMQRPKQMMCNSKINPPVVRKQNAYLIEKPQVNPDRITRLLPDDKPKVWTGGMRRDCYPPPPTKSNYNETSDGTSSLSASSKTLVTTDVNSSYSGMATTKTNPFTTSSDINSSLSTVPTTMKMHFPGIKSFQKYKYPSVESTTQKTESTSSSDFDCPTSYINNTVSNSSRSSYWLPPKRLARESRELPKLNPSNIFQVRPTFSKEVIKLFQRAPKSSKK